MTTRELDETKQTGLNAPTTFFHMHKDIVQSGGIATLGCGALRVYLVIKSHTNLHTGESNPSIPTIAKESGLSERQVINSIKELQTAGYVSRNKAGRSNIYTTREKVNIKNDNGEDQAVATWEYIPNQMKDAMKEVKNVLITGQLVDGKIIHIESLTLNILNDYATQVNVNGADKKSEIAKENILTMKKILKKKS